MYLKKLIGAFTALIMTVTVFAGSAVSVSATDSIVTPNTSYTLQFYYNDTMVDTKESLSKEQAETYMSRNAILEVKEGNYSGTYSVDFISDPVSSYTYSFDKENHLILTEIRTYTITVIKQQTIQVSINGNGTVQIGNTSYTNGQSFTGTVGSEYSLKVSASENNYIKSIKLGNNELTTEASNMYSALISIPEYGGTLTVEFGSPHSIIISESITGGTVTSLSGETANEGDTVMLSVVPNTNYELDRLSVKNSSNEDVVVNNASEGSNVYTFNMPGSAVTITAIFKGLLPNSSEALLYDNYDELLGDHASLYEGRLDYRGLSFKPQVTVTLKNGSTQKAISDTMVTNGSVVVEVVVNKDSEEISSVLLEGIEYTDSQYVE